MTDQVEALLSKRVDVILWNGETSQEESQQIRVRLYDRRQAPPKLLYITPEKLVESHVLRGALDQLYKDNRLARFVCDEAHCIAGWGRDFRDAVCLKLESTRTQVLKYRDTVPAT